MATYLIQSMRVGVCRNIRYYSCDIGKGLVVGLYQKENESDEPRLTANGELYDAKCEGRLQDAIRECALTGELGKGKLLSALDKEFGSVCVVGLGRENTQFCEREGLHCGMENVRIAAGIGAHQLTEQGCKTIYVDPMVHAEQAAEGSALAIWKYQENKAKSARKHVPKLELYESAEVDSWTRGLFKADAQNLARTLTEAPANQLTPSAFAQTAIDALCPCGVNVEIRNQEWIETKNLKGFMTVAKGSCEPPVFLELNYHGDDKGDKPIVLVGSGVTFNSGSYAGTKAPMVDLYRADMCGASVIVAAMRAAAALSLPLNLVGVIPLCENMPSGMAFRPGDLVQTSNGSSIAINVRFSVTRWRNFLKFEFFRVQVT